MTDEQFTHEIRKLCLMIVGVHKGAKALFASTILIIFVLMIAHFAHAAESSMPIYANLIQCGPIEQAVEMCMDDDKHPCCNVVYAINPSASGDTAEQVIQLRYDVLENGTVIETEAYQ